MVKRRSIVLLPVRVVLILLTLLVAQAQAIPIGWSCTGNCGTMGANGVVTTPPLGGQYEYVTSNGGVSLGANDLNIGSETNGSRLLTNVFSALAGDALEFDFNYVTSDGAIYVEYAWARLFDDSNNPVALLFHARTNATPGANTVPGAGLPPIAATMTPAATPIIPGGPVWAPLGGSSGDCFSTGCGYTGWIHSTYLIPAAGNYYLEFGVVNWLDTAYDSGMAISGTTIGGEPIVPEQAPEPAVVALLGLGLLAVARRVKR